MSVLGKPISDFSFDNDLIESYRVMSPLSRIDDAYQLIIMDFKVSAKSLQHIRDIPKDISSCVSTICFGFDGTIYSINEYNDPETKIYRYNSDKISPEMNKRIESHTENLYIGFIEWSGKDKYMYIMDDEWDLIEVNADGENVIDDESTEIVAINGDKILCYDNKNYYLRDLSNDTKIKLPCDKIDYVASGSSRYFYTKVKHPPVLYTHNINSGEIIKTLDLHSVTESTIRRCNVISDRYLIILTHETHHIYDMKSNRVITDVEFFGEPTKIDEMISYPNFFIYTHLTKGKFRLVIYELASHIRETSQAQ